MHPYYQLPYSKVENIQQVIYIFRNSLLTNHCVLRFVLFVRQSHCHKQQQGREGSLPCYTEGMTRVPELQTTVGCKFETKTIDIFPLKVLHLLTLALNSKTQEFYASLKFKTSMYQQQIVMASGCSCICCAHFKRKLRAKYLCYEFVQLLLFLLLLS